MGRPPNYEKLGRAVARPYRHQFLGAGTQMTTLLKRIAQLEPAPPWTVGAVILTLIAAFIAIIMGTFFGFAVFDPEARYRDIAGWTVSMALIIALVWQTRHRDREWLRLKPPSTPLPLILFVAFGAAVATDLVGLAITGVVLPAAELVNFGAMGLIEWLFAIVFMLVAQPIAEELVFRGVAFPVVRTLFNAWGGLVISALLYALFHLLAYPISSDAPPAVGLWYSLLQPLIAGLVISAVRAATGSTRAAVIAHAAFGLFAVLKLFIVVTG